MAGRRRRSRRSRGRKLFLAVLALCLAAVYPLQEQLADDGGNSGGTGNAAAEDISAAASGVFRDGSTLEVHYLDVGQGDATLIVCGDGAMLIDAGNNSWGDDVRDYLEYQGVEDLDYVIGTHPDADHIGGLDVVMEAFDCGTVIMPDYEKETKTYEEVIDVMNQKGLELTLPQVGTVYELGEAAFTIVAPQGDYGDNANDYSVGGRGFGGRYAEQWNRSVGGCVQGGPSWQQDGQYGSFPGTGRPWLCGDQLRRGQQLRSSPCGGAEPSPGNGNQGVPYRRGRDHYSHV